MRNFIHINPKNLEEASDLLKEGRTRLLAGGTDLLGELKDEVLPEYPERIVNLKSIPGLCHIREEEDGLHIGALVPLREIAQSPLVQNVCPAAAQAAASVASPLIRNSATLGGNLFQEVRCWYYRCPSQNGGAVMCARKGGERCYAAVGESRYHSIFGGTKVRTTPCTSKCPAEVDIPAYMERLRAGDIEGAARILLRNNPIPAVTSRVCTHFCQEGCSRNQVDERVGTGQVERFLGDYILEHADRLMAPPEKETGHRIAVVGAGPAGLSAAFYLRQAGHSVRVYEKMPEPGGLLRYAIPAYRLPKEVVQKLTDALRGMGVEFQCGTNVGTDISMEELSRTYDRVFAAPGAWKKTVIGMGGEELTRFGLEFLVEVKGWMQDKPGKRVAVVGGGNVAVDVAVTAKRLGAEQVTMISLESREELPATREELERAEQEGVRLMPSWGPTEVCRQGDAIRGIRLRRCLSVRDEKGRFSPVYDDGDCEEVACDAILLCVGQQTDLSFLGQDFMLEQNRGRIAADAATQEASDPRVYAGGDVVTGPATVVGALAAGRRAAACITASFGDGTVGREEEPAGGLLHFSEKACRPSRTAKLHIRPMEELAVDLEDDFGLSREEVLAEAERCLNCGCLAVNPSDMAAVLMCLDGEIVTNMRRISARELLGNPVRAAEVLEPGEIMKEAIIPDKWKGWMTSYRKFRDRKSIDFATVSLASAYRLEEGKIKEARIILGAVAPVPVEAEKAETCLAGKSADAETAEAAAEAALAGAFAARDNQYKILIAKSLVRQSVLACADAKGGRR